MPATIRLDIVSAERELFSGECEMVVAPGAMGELGILPRHTPLITRLKPGEVRATMAGGEEQSFYVSGGMLEIQPHVVTVLSDTGQRAEDLDEAAALLRRSRPNACSRIGRRTSTRRVRGRSSPRPSPSSRRSAGCAAGAEAATAGAAGLQVQAARQRNRALRSATHPAARRTSLPAYSAFSFAKLAWRSSSSVKPTS